MKFNIAKSIDVNKLNEQITKFQIEKNYNPYVFVNVDMVNELSGECVVKKLGSLTSTGVRYEIGTYRGCRVFIDDTKTFGEVELR